MISMVQLWLWYYVIYLQMMWPCRFYFMLYDDHGLVGITWSIMTIRLFDLCEVCEYISTCECSIRVYAWSFLLTIWVYDGYMDDDMVMYRMT